MALEFLDKPLTGPRWARLDRIIGWKEEATRSLYWEWYLSYASATPLWRKPFFVAFGGLCLVALLAILVPLWFPLPLPLARALFLFAVGAFGLQTIWVWMRSKGVWLRFLRWARVQEEAAPGNVSFAEIVVPPNALALTHGRWPLVAIGATGLFPICLAMELKIHSAFADYFLLFAELYAIIFVAVVGPILPPAFCLADAIYWRVYSKRHADWLCHLIAFIFLCAFCGVYALALLTAISRIPDSGFTSILSFFGSIFILGGAAWWFGLWLGQGIFASREGALRERFESECQQTEVSSQKVG